jgi:hypothetical protein
MSDPRTPAEQAQKSEVHHATEDASSAPSNADNVKTDTGNPSGPLGMDGLPEHSFEELEKTFPEDVRVRRDLSDVGGPIDLEMDEN